MAEYDLISKTALLEHLDMAMECENCPRNADKELYKCVHNPTPERCTCSEIAQICIRITDFEVSTDVQPVKRGFWKALMMSEETGWDLSLTGGHDTVCEYVCSVCGKPNIVDEFGDSYLPNFCPNCGARMMKDGDTE